MLIAISIYKKQLDEVDAHRAKHHAYLKTLFAAGKLLVCGRQKSQLGGVIIAKNISREEFQQILRDDPFVQEGMAEYAITEFTPSLCDPSIDSFLN